jgi:hypothetical protein
VEALYLRYLEDGRTPEQDSPARAGAS